MVQLQRPEWVYCNGALRHWDEAVIHVGSEAAIRGLNVFEGLKGYWSHDGGSFGIVAMPRHFARLKRSARLLHVPCDWTYEAFEDASHELFRRLLEPGRDMWLRATLFVVEGHWGVDDVSDLVLQAYHQPMERPEPITVGVSTWQRARDVSLPPRIKTGPNYQVARLARIEGRGRGFSEMVLLNASGRVAEATGACLLMVRDGTIYTTPPSEGRLESITVDILASLARSMGIPFEERPIDRTELHIADEMALAGTLAEIVKVERVDDYPLPAESPVLDALADRFWAAVRGADPHPSVDLSVVEGAPTARVEV